MGALASSRGLLILALLLPISHSTAAVCPIEQAMAKRKPADRLKALAEAAKNLSVKEIPAALQTARRLQQLRERAVFEEAVLKRWSELAARDAFACISVLAEGRIKIESIRFAAEKFATENCVEAAKAVQKMSAGRAQNEAVDIVAGIWARKDLKPALKWAMNLPQGFARETALNSVRFVWVHSDPVSAADHVKDLPAGDTKNALLTNIAGEWAAFDPKAALLWGNKLCDGPEKDLVIANIAESWADNDPTAAGCFALTLSGELKQSAIAGVISRWATQNPETALNWALKNGADFRPISDALNLWASVDASSAGKWVEKLPPDFNRDAAIQSYVEAVITWDPADALRFARKLTNESARSQHVEKCLQRWMELDRSSAEKWLAANDQQSKEAAQ